jgi:hypothetical protein
MAALGLPLASARAVLNEADQPPKSVRRDIDLLTSTD